MLGLFQKFRNGIRFIDSSISDKSKTGFYALNKVTPDEVARIKRLIGIDVSGYHHEINSNDLRHSLKAHGNKEREEKRNPPQIAITANDLKMIPKIIQDYDDIEKGSVQDGRKSIIYKKRVNGFIYYAEVVLKDKKVLSGKTMWKRPSGSADASSLTPGNTSKTATSPSLNVSINEIMKPVKPVLESATIDREAHKAASSPKNSLPEPTEKQKESGNYKKGHVTIRGLDIAIENPAGSERSGIGADGEKWVTKMHHHYGYIKGTKGRDKDHLDVFLGPDPEREGHNSSIIFFFALLPQHIDMNSF